MAGDNRGIREPSRLYLIYDELEPADLPSIGPDQQLIAFKWPDRREPPAGSRVLLRLADDQIRELVPLAIEREWEIGVLPHPGSVHAMRALGVKGEQGPLVDHYLRANPIEAGVLCCNDQAVFTSVVIGDVLGLKPYDAARPPTRRAAFFGALRAVKGLRLRDYRLTTGKEQRIQMAALGIVVLEHTQSTLVGRSFSDALDISDGRLTLLALAPRSVLSYLGFLFRLLIPRKINLSRLPGPVGMIRSDQVLIEAPRGVDYALDGTLASAKALDLRVRDGRIRLLPGPALVPREDRILTKDRVRLGQLPVGDAARELAEAPLPFFSHASEDEHRDLFVALRASASLSSAFVVLTVLSTLLALMGLYANSAPVIIGAMILAPLMTPIISLAMGLARTDASLIRGALRTLAIGVGSALFCAVAVAWIMPLEHLTAEMQARVSPTLLDLSVAVISGVAGAYAHAKEEIAKSLAGVAIAVALVPPLSVAGVGLGWGDWAMASGAALLFVTNLVGISVAASMTFLVMGFAPFRLAKNGLAISLVMLAVIIGPLYVAFGNLVDQGRIANLIPTGRIALAGETVGVHTLEVRAGKPPLVRVILYASRPLDESHVDALKELISARAGQAVQVEAQLDLRR